MLSGHRCLPLLILQLALGAVCVFGRGFCAIDPASRVESGHCRFLMGARMRLSVRRVNVAVVLALAIGFLISWQIGSLDTERRRSEARAKVVSEMATRRARLEGVFQSSFSATEGMVHLIAYQGGISREAFAALTSQILSEHPAIRHLALAPDNVVRMVYPLPGNESLLGFDYRSIPAQWQTVERSRELRKPLLAGPVQLVQGGRALIIRTPVFSARPRDSQTQERYWGTLANVIRLETLLEIGGIDNRQLTLALRGRDALGKDGALIYGSSETFDQQPVVMDIDVPGGHWQMAGMPIGGWPVQSPMLSSYFLFGMMNTLLLAAIVGLLVRRRELMRLRNQALMREVAERRLAERALSESEARFRRLFESSPDPVWIIDDGCFIACNNAAANALGYLSSEMLLNRTLADVSPPTQDSGETSKARAEHMMASARSQGTYRFEWCLQHTAGRVFPTEMTLSAVTLQGRDALYCVWRDISTLKRDQAELVRLAHYDGLTGLPNRILLLDRLSHAIEHARRQKTSVGLLVLDLDGFKTVNDSLGHPVGDRLLEQVSTRIQACVRADDTVARLGGDEFAIVMGDLHAGHEVVDVVRKVLDAVEVPFDIDGAGALVTSSVGIAIFPDDAESCDELIRNADTAMYGAKEGGRNTYRFYQRSMTQLAQSRLYLEQALRRALQQNELEVWYQPQISLQDGACVGVEALVRWRDPVRGLVSPAEFIPLAEQSGLIVPIGEQVFELACQAVARWREAGLGFGRLGVNVAGAQITRSDFVGMVSDTLHRHGLPASLFSVEVTETLLMENMERAIEVLEALKVTGMTTAIDDFGTGYSSLEYLKRLPIDILKIDRTFVRDVPGDEQDMAITRAIVALGHTLGFQVIAEGVETEAQEAFLRSEGCHEGQGFLYAKPLPEPELVAWLQAHQVVRAVVT